MKCPLSFSTALSEHPRKQKSVAGHPPASSCILISNILSGLTGSVRVSSETPRATGEFTLRLEHGNAGWGRGARGCSHWKAQGQEDGRALGKSPGTFKTSRWYFPVISASARKIYRT